MISDNIKYMEYSTNVTGAALNFFPLASRASEISVSLARYANQQNIGVEVINGHLFRIIHLCHKVANALSKPIYIVGFV